MPRLQWPAYRTVRELVAINHGRPALILGGGESLREGVRTAPVDCVHISANDHGARILKDNPQLGRTLDYIVACDKAMEKRARADCKPMPEGKPARDGKPWNVPVITRHCHGDFRLLHMAGRSSGMCAAYIARLMGCAPIIVTGMDLYAGPTYYDDPHGFSTGRNFTERMHIERWQRMTQQYPGQYRAIGCNKKLAAVLGHYDPAEKSQPVSDVVRLIAECNGTYVRFLRDAALTNSRSFRKGDVVELPSGEANQQVRKRNVVRMRQGDVEKWITQQGLAPAIA